MCTEVAKAGHFKHLSVAFTDLFQQFIHYFRLLCSLANTNAMTPKLTVYSRLKK